MDENIYRKNVHELDLMSLAQLCANVARNLSANSKQSDTAHALRVEWVRLSLDHSLNRRNRTKAETSLKKCMAEFLAEVPNWMLTGV